MYNVYMIWKPENNIFIRRKIWNVIRIYFLCIRTIQLCLKIDAHKYYDSR